MFKRTQTKFSTFRRIADIVCALLVVFYVLFDVLDLDGSNACRIANHQDHSAMVGETDSDLRFDDSLKLMGAQSAVVPLVGQNSNEYSRPRWPKTSPVPLAIGGRSHGDRGCRIETSASGTSPDH